MKPAFKNSNKACNLFPINYSICKRNLQSFPYQPLRFSFTTNKQEPSQENFEHHKPLEKDLLVKKGKEKLVGAWLLLTAGSVLLMILLGGYTRLSKSGLSMTKWKPIAYKYPSNQQEWEAEFENYKVILCFLIVLTRFSKEISRISN